MNEEMTTIAVSKKTRDRIVDFKSSKYKTADEVISHLLDWKNETTE